jgi:modulator of FtsH protease HflK
VNEALGDVARFNSQFTEFKKAPDVTRTRLYLETLKEVIPQMGEKIIIDEDASQILPLLQLNSNKQGGLVR